jgi:hypothetical protein
MADEGAFVFDDRMAGYGCGFNRSMQHTEDCMNSEGCCNEAKTADLLHRKPESVNVGTLAERRIASEDRPAV